MKDVLDNPIDLCFWGYLSSIPATAPPRANLGENMTGVISVA